MCVVTASNFRRRTGAALLLAALLPTALVFSASQSFAAAGDAPLRVILPVSAGSGLDAIMRAVAPSLGKALGGQSVIIENQPGAGGITGSLAVVRAAPDGQTIGLVSNNYAVNPSVYKKMPFDALNDITPITVIGATPFLLLVNPKVPAKNAKELQAFLKAKPGAYNYASSGNGTVIQLAAALFVDAADVQVHHIPYKGTAPMMADLIGGQVEMGVFAVPAVQGQVKSGSLRAIGVMGKQRVASLPDVPTFIEQGFPEVDIEGWFAVIGPPKMPAAEVKRLHDAIVTAFAMPEAKEAMAKQDNVIAPTTPEAAAAFFRSEVDRYARLVKKANITID